MSNYSYWKYNKERQELQAWKDQIIQDIKIYIDTRLDEIKDDIVRRINKEIDIYTTTFLNGKKIDIRNNIADYVIKEITTSIK